MRTKLQKWGNSLGLRIPKVFALEAAMHAGATVEISIAPEGLVIRPVHRRIYSLSDLLRGVTPTNVHAAIDTGPPRGRESW
jgi:antitoxin MazE